MGHPLDNLKFDQESNSILTGSVFNMFNSIQLEYHWPNPWDKDRGGSVEVKRDENGKWVKKDLVVTNKLNAIAGAVRVGEKIYLGSR